MAKKGERRWDMGYLKKIVGTVHIGKDLKGMYETVHGVNAKNTI